MTTTPQGPRYLAKRARTEQAFSFRVSDGIVHAAPEEQGINGRTFEEAQKELRRAGWTIARLNEGGTWEIE